LELNSTGCPDFELLNSPECPFVAPAAAGAGVCGGGDTILTTTSSRADAAAAVGFDTQTPIFHPFINPTKTQERDFAFYLLKGFTVYLIFSHQFCFWIIGFLWDLGKKVCLIRRLWFFGLCINRLPVVTVSLTAKYLQCSAIFYSTVSQKHCLL
jgi:hypothetical protein